MDYLGNLVWRSHDPILYLWVHMIQSYRVLDLYQRKCLNELNEEQEESFIQKKEVGKWDVLEQPVLMPQPLVSHPDAGSSNVNAFKAVVVKQ